MRAQRSSSATLAVVGLAFLALMSTSAHTVRAGETLKGIAAANGTTVAALASANHLADADLILVGQQLAIPGSAGSTSSSTYKVRSGDTLGSDRGEARHVRVGDRAAQPAVEPQPHPDRAGAEGPGRLRRDELERSRGWGDDPRRARRGRPSATSRPGTGSRWPRSWRPTGSRVIASTSASSSASSPRPARPRPPPTPTSSAPATRCPASPRSSAAPSGPYRMPTESATPTSSASGGR